MSNYKDTFTSLLQKTAELYAAAAAKHRAANTLESAEATTALMAAATAYHEARASAKNAHDFLDALAAFAVTEEVDALEALAVVEEAEATAIAADAAFARSLVGV